MVVMVVEFDNTDQDIELLTNRISQALYAHTKMIAAEKGEPDYGFSFLAVKQDDEEGWVDVAVTARNEDMSAAYTRIYRVTIEQCVEPKKGD